MLNLKDVIISNRYLYCLYIKIKLFFQLNNGISKKRLFQLIGKNPIIIEIGAHVGSDTVEMAVMWPKSTIYAFEPIDHVFKRLQFKTKNFKNIEIIQAAITDVQGSGKAEMHVSPNSDCSSSLLKPKDHLVYCPEVVFSEKTVSINTLVLKDWLKKKNIESVDLIWMDVQGMELNILKSLEESIRFVKFIYAEVSLKEFYEGSGSYDEIKSYLGGCGFELVADDLADGEIMGNALFKNISIK